MKKIFRSVKSWFGLRTASVALQTVEQVTQQAASEVDSYIAPVRQSVFKRFPVIFTLLVTFGVAATFYGFEMILARYQLLQQYPWLILSLGIGTLVATGTLYKKLG